MKKSEDASGVPKRSCFSASWAIACLFGVAICGGFFSSLLRAQDASNPSQEPTRSKSKIFVPSPSASERATPGQLRILEIEYSSKRTDVPLNEDKIRQNMRSSKGGVYSQQMVDGDIESLYKTGDFGNVQIITSEMRGDGGEPGVRLTVLVDPLVKEFLHFFYYRHFFS